MTLHFFLVILDIHLDLLVKKLACYKFFPGFLLKFPYYLHSNDINNRHDLTSDHRPTETERQDRERERERQENWTVLERVMRARGAECARVGPHVLYPRPLTTNVTRRIIIPSRSLSLAFYGGVKSHYCECAQRRVAFSFSLSLPSFSLSVSAGRLYT